MDDRQLEEVTMKMLRRLRGEARHDVNAADRSAARGLRRLRRRSRNRSAAGARY
ncbi:hypothetical protein MXD59_05380 [Frankia sp. Ag45/Mut15]|uniref:Uncharacterized protein n=1 Tax=Frankia umida TaxID=573489 RepID=A0ABT0JVG3_9ACTN|nr:hypothetical protein [Frankia umida]MCK9875217.1 hypothetical protein [Frankia umida]